MFKTIAGLFPHAKLKVGLKFFHILLKRTAEKFIGLKGPKIHNLLYPSKNKFPELPSVTFVTLI